MCVYGVQISFDILVLKLELLTFFSESLLTLNLKYIEKRLFPEEKKSQYLFV